MNAIGGRPGCWRGIGWMLVSVGSCFGLPGAVASPAASSDVQVVHQFRDVHHGGTLPYGALLQASDGALYGATFEGGLHNAGTLFRIGADGSFSTFSTFFGPDGSNPVGDLVQAGDGGLYGVTAGNGQDGSHTVFRIGLDGTRETLYSFGEGYGSSSGMTLSSDGNMYGVAGGVTFYRVSSQGTFSWFAQFTNRLVQDCGSAVGRLAAMSDGNLYGVTGRCVYVMHPNGHAQVLYRSQGNFYPGSILGGNDGYLYVTAAGRTGKTCGKLYQFTTAGQFRILKAWDCRMSQSLLPALVQGADGALHGALYRDSKEGYRSRFFRLTVDGNYAEQPIPLNMGFNIESMILATDGYFYANSSNGGHADAGTVLRTTGGD